MCCNRINTETIMANLFAANSNQPREQRSLSMESMREYVNFLSQMFPEYLVTDFCEQTVRQCVAEFPTLYQIKEDTDGDGFIVQATEKIPNLNFFNMAYSDGIAKYIEEITSAYLENKNLQKEIIMI